MDRSGLGTTEAAERAPIGVPRPAEDGERGSAAGDSGARAVFRSDKRLNLVSIGVVVAGLWLLEHIAEARPPQPHEALAWRYLRALADHPLRTGLATVLVAGALAGRRALWREP